MIKKSVGWTLLINFIALFLVGVSGIYFFPQTLISSFALVFLFFYSKAKGGTIFHPIPLVSIVMIWSLSLAPLAAVGFENYLVRAPKQIDWVTWMQVISWVYTVGVLLFLFGALLFLKKIKNNKSNKIFYSRKKLNYYAPIFLILSLLMQIYVFSRFGGITGYLLSWSEDRTMFDGLGPALMLAEAFPILCFIVFVLFFDKERIKSKPWIILLVFLVFIVLKLIFGGFRGSRSNTIWGVFWFAGIVHIYYFRLKFSQFLFGGIFLLAFMTSYTVYKSFGVDAFSGSYSLDDTSRFEGGAIESILLGDFSRAGVNAYILSAYFNWELYDLKLGTTYLESLSKILPGFSGGFGGYSKGAAGSELFYETQANQVSAGFHNSRIFGLYGEGVLNFGPFVALLLFFIAGVIIAVLDNFCRGLREGDPKLLMVPFIANIGIMIMLADSDNFIFFFLKNGLLAFMLLWLITIKRKFVPRLS